MEKGKAETQKLNEELADRHYEFRSNCDDGKGDASACHSYGEWVGLIDRDHKRAAEIYAQNCQQKNYPASCFNLGRLYGQEESNDQLIQYIKHTLNLICCIVAGKGVEMNDEKAVSYFDKACKMEHNQACHNLGVMYMNGLGVEKSQVKGLELLEKSCEANDFSSCFRIGSLYLTTKAGNEVKRDVLQAEKFMKKACDGNFAPACHNLAVLYRKGDSVIGKNPELFEKYSSKTKMLAKQAGGSAGVKVA